MPRPLRPDVPDGWYHVMNRGADRQDIFSDDVDLVQFESLLADAVDRFGVEIHAYCLMTNHFHLVVHCPIGGLSRAMQSVERRYTQSYNERYRRDGPLFRGRFHSVDVDDERAAGSAHAATSTATPSPSSRPSRWRPIGGRATASTSGAAAAPPWLTLGEVAAVVGADVEAHRAFVETPQPTDAIDAGALVQLGHHLSIDGLLEVVGAVAGVERGIDHIDGARAIECRADSGAHAGDRTPPRADHRPRRPVPPCDGVERADHCPSRSRRGHPRSRIVVAARTRARRARSPSATCCEVPDPARQVQVARSMCLATRFSSCSCWPLARTILGSSARARSWSDASVCLPSRIDWPRSPDQPA